MLGEAARRGSRTHRHAGRRQLRRPGLVVVLGFAGGIALVTLLLLVPAAAQAAKQTTFREALFTATSAVCVTGLIVIDTPSRWSTFWRSSSASSSAGSGS